MASIFKKTPRVQGTVSIMLDPHTAQPVLTVNGKPDPRLNGEYLARCGMRYDVAFTALKAAGNCVSAITEKLVNAGKFSRQELARMEFEEIDPFA